MEITRASTVRAKRCRRPLPTSTLAPRELCGEEKKKRAVAKRKKKGRRFVAPLCQMGRSLRQRGRSTPPKGALRSYWGRGGGERETPLIHALFHALFRALFHTQPKRTCPDCSARDLPAWHSCHDGRDVGRGVADVASRDGIDAGGGIDGGGGGQQRVQRWRCARAREREGAGGRGSAGARRPDRGRHAFVRRWRARRAFGADGRVSACVR